MNLITRGGSWRCVLLCDLENAFRIAVELQYFWEDMFQNLQFKMLYLIEMRERWIKLFLVVSPRNQTLNFTRATWILYHQATIQLLIKHVIGGGNFKCVQWYMIEYYKPLDSHFSD
jgi:hypothetical protein